MVKAELREIAFTILCDCGREFRAEDFKPECPYCGRIYWISMTTNPREIRVEARLLGRTSSETCNPR